MNSSRIKELNGGCIVYFLRDYHSKTQLDLMLSYTELTHTAHTHTQRTHTQHTHSTHANCWVIILTLLMKAS